MSTAATNMKFCQLYSLKVYQNIDKLMKPNEINLSQKS